MNKTNGVTKGGFKRYTRPSKPVKKNIRRTYTHETYNLNRYTIHKFVRPSWHREFRESHINKLKMSFMRGQHFSETITVNKNKGMVVLNGNHRIEAVRRIIENHPNFSMEITLTKYQKLSHEKELEIYDKVNNTRPESVLDRLKAHCINSLLMQREKDFPMRILFRNPSYCDADSLPITTVAYPYLLRNSTGFMGGNLNIHSINELNDEDIDRMIEFFRLYKEIFGNFTRKNLYFSKALISVMAKIFYVNVGVDISRKQLIERLKRLLRTHTGTLQMYMSQGTLHKEMYNFILGKLSGRKKLYNILTGVKDNDKKIKK